jgi:hypothetical protein
MLADLDLLLIAVFCAADDLLPARPKNARRMLTDAETPRPLHQFLTNEVTGAPLKPVGRPGAIEAAHRLSAVPAPH